MVLRAISRLRGAPAALNLTGALGLCGLVAFPGALAAQADDTQPADPASGSSETVPADEAPSQAPREETAADQNRTRSIQLLLNDLASCRERGTLLETALREMTAEMRAACAADREALDTAKDDLQNCRADERQNRTTNRRLNEELMACRDGTNAGSGTDTTALEAENERLEEALANAAADRDAARQAAQDAERKLSDLRQALDLAREEIARLQQDSGPEPDILDGQDISDADPEESPEPASTEFAFATGEARSSLAGLEDAGSMLSPGRRPNEAACGDIHQWLAQQDTEAGAAPLVWVWENGEARLCAGLSGGRVRIGPGSSYDRAYVVGTR